MKRALSGKILLFVFLGIFIIILSAGIILIYNGNTKQKENNTVQNSNSESSQTEESNQSKPIINFRPVE